MTPVNKSKENNILRLPSINDKPVLQRQASAILGGVIQSKYSRPDSKQGPMQ